MVRFRDVDVMRTSAEIFDATRQRMAAICSGCHSGDFMRLELQKGDAMIREAERKLYDMHLEHRMHAFQGAFHMSYDFAFWRAGVDSRGTSRISGPWTRNCGLLIAPAPESPHRCLYTAWPWKITRPAPRCYRRFPHPLPLRPRRGQLPTGWP